jgi:hypothetical protein
MGVFFPENDTYHTQQTRDSKPHDRIIDIDVDEFVAVPVPVVVVVVVVVTVGGIATITHLQFEGNESPKALVSTTA